MSAQTSFFHGSSHATVRNSTFTVNNNFNTHGTAPDPLRYLYERTSPSAVHTYEHDNFDPPKCHPGTREAIFRRLKNWLLGLIESNALVLWLYGAAGAGKSAIALSFAEICAEAGLLLGAFFFSKSDASRSGIKPLVPTIAFQISQRHPSTQACIGQAIQADHGIFDRSLEDQLERLVAAPLRELRTLEVNGCTNQVIIVDGLDECRDKGAQQRLVRILTSFAIKMNSEPNSHRIRIIIASRPEHHLVKSFNAIAPRYTLTRIALNDQYSNSKDIKLFIVDKLREAREDYPSISTTWPGDDAINKLVQKSSGQFIYAKLALSYVMSGSYAPPRALDIVLNVTPPVSVTDMPFAELDAMYHHILSNYKDPGLGKLILGIRLIASFELELDQKNRRPLSTIPEIASLLDVDPSDVSCFINHLSSVIAVLPDGYLVIQHASLVDFLLDASRSREYHTDSSRLYSQLAAICLNKLSESSDFGNLSDSRALKYLPHFLRLSEMTADLRDNIMSIFSRWQLMPGSSPAEPLLCLLRLEEFWQMVGKLYNAVKTHLTFRDMSSLREGLESTLCHQIAPIKADPVLHCLVDYVTVIHPRITISWKSAIETDSTTLPILEFVTLNTRLTSSLPRFVVEQLRRSLLGPGGGSFSLASHYYTALSLRKVFCPSPLLHESALLDPLVYFLRKSDRDREFISFINFDVMKHFESLPKNICQIKCGALLVFTACIIAYLETCSAIPHPNLIHFLKDIKSLIGPDIQKSIPSFDLRRRILLLMQGIDDTGATPQETEVQDPNHRLYGATVGHYRGTAFDQCLEDVKTKYLGVKPGNQDPLMSYWMIAK